MLEAVNSLITTIKGGLAVTTTRAGAHVRTVRASASSVAPPAKGGAGRVPKASVAVARVTSSAATRPTTGKRQGATAMPFAALMDGFRAPARALQPVSSQRVSFPEMQNGVATGRRVEVHVPVASTPKIDAAATARKILAAGARARGGK